MTSEGSTTLVKRLSRRASLAYGKALTFINTKRQTIDFGCVASSPARPPKQENSMGSVEDLFRVTVLLNAEKHDILLRYAYLEYTENVVFLFDALQEVLDEESLTQRASMLVRIYDMHVSQECKGHVRMDYRTYETVSILIDRIRNNTYTETDVNNIIQTLDDLTVAQLMKSHRRLTALQTREERAPSVDIDSPITPQVTSTCSSTKKYQVGVTEDPIHELRASTPRKRFPLMNFIRRKSVQMRMILKK